jgi:hypothetical protein
VKNQAQHILFSAITSGFCLILSGCGGGGSSTASTTTPTPVVTYIVSVTASTVGSGETFVFGMNGQTISVTQNATKTSFATALASGTSYAVTQTSGPRACTLSANSSGTIVAHVEVIAACGGPAASGGGTPPATGVPTGYSGTVSYDVDAPTIKVSGTATVSVALSRQFADVRHYALRSGTFTGTFSLPGSGCSAVTATVNLKAKVASDESAQDELLVWTSAAAAPSAMTQDIDFQIATGQPLNFACPGGVVSVSASDFSLGYGGDCAGTPLAPWSNVNALTGNHACLVQGTKNISWTLTAVAGG